MSNSSIIAAFERMWQHIVNILGNKADVSHTHSLSSLGVTATTSELNKLDGVTATTTELNYIDGVTSNIQTQLDAKVPTSRTVNGKALNSNISLAASDVSAIATSGVNTLTGTLYINNETDVSYSANGNVALIIGNRTGEHLAFDGNEIMAKTGTTTAGVLYLGGGSECTVSIDGKFRLNSYSFGNSLPAAGQTGRIFFKKA